MAHKEAHGKGQEHSMTLTEDEAKNKRCQESYPAAEGLSMGGFTEAVPSYSPGYSAGAGTYARQTAPLMCIGSACMAWRWKMKTRFKEGSPEYYPTERGYCGKAGRPME